MSYRILMWPAPLLAGFVVVIALWAPQSARAQSASYFDRNNNVGVLDRPRPDYEALGIPVGGFTFYPTATIAPEYNDNIFATTKDQISDLITVIEPTVELKSNWARNEVDLRALAKASLYADHSSEDTTDYQFSGSGRLDILSQSNITAGLTLGHYAIPRTAQNTFGPTDKPVQYDGAAANLGALQVLNRLEFSEGLQFERVTYQNNTDSSGLPLTLDQLDNDTFSIRARAAYAVTPSIAVFVSALGNDRRYDELPPVASIDRNSAGFETTVGTDFDITRLIRGRVEVGYLQQYYASSLFRTVGGAAVHAKVEYFPSGLTTITLHADRQVIDAIDPVAVSYLQTQIGLEVDHELLRNVILSGRADYATADYTGEQRHDERTTASVRATYLLNRHLGVTATYTFVDEYSAGAARVPSYRNNVVSISLVLDE